MKEYNPYLDDGKFYSVKEVGDLYWASNTTVYKWIKSGRIKSRKYKKRYKITGKQLRAFSMAGQDYYLWARYHWSEYYGDPYMTIFRRKKPFPDPLKRGY